jgi:hypothetical protein
MSMSEGIGTYQFINRFYGDDISTVKMSLLELSLENPKILSEVNSCLEILSTNSTLVRFIKKATYLSTRTNKLEFQQSGKDAKPDLLIHTDELEISCEVKRIKEKLAKKPRGVVHIINDITTVRTAFEKSVGKGQYFTGTPHIIYFDCPELSEGEIHDTFYPIAGPDTSITLEINHKLVHPSITYNGYFQEKDSSMVSGVACKFFTGRFIPKISEIVYFPNPGAMITIPEKIIGELGFRVSTA